MSRNGSGTYSLYTPGNPVVTGTTISSTAFNNTMNDIAAALTASIAADGQTPITANISLNSHKLTSVTAGSSSGDALSFGQVGASLENLTLTGATVPANGIYLSAANTLALASNTTLRWSVSSTGAHTFATPTSGNAVTISAAAASAALVLTGVSGTSALAISTGGGSNVNIGYNVGLAASKENFYANGTNGFAIGTAGNAALSLWSNAVERITVAAAGNVTIAAPSSGDTVTINGATSGSFRVNATGLPYGTAIHNNAGAVTGTTNQYIASGTYTPTITNVSNLAASTVNGTWRWTRVGNVVSVDGNVSIDPTASAATTFGISLPIASNFTTAYQASGSGTWFDSTLRPIGIYGDSVNDRMEAVIGPGGTANAEAVIHFQYEVL